MSENVIGIDLTRWSPNMWPGRDGHKPVAVINHYSQGDLASMINWFLNKASEVSAHFAVAKDGRIVQFVRTIDTAWANGLLEVEESPLPWLQDCITRGINPNKKTVSIEHEAVLGDWLTPPQFAATVRLHRYICRRWSIPMTREFIRGHNDISPKTRANCPGYTFVFDEIIASLQNWELIKL